MNEKPQLKQAGDAYLTQGAESKQALDKLAKHDELGEQREAALSKLGSQEMSDKIKASQASEVLRQESVKSHSSEFIKDAKALAEEMGMLKKMGKPQNPSDQKLFDMGLDRLNQAFDSQKFVEIYGQEAPKALDSFASVNELPLEAKYILKDAVLKAMAGQDKMAA
ncbi:MAG: hypothetical protein PHC53_04590 [Patescibacteria group bacterium]|nr:hypothetical protein [Patescibacteria group bacterium]